MTQILMFLGEKDHVSSMIRGVLAGIDSVIYNLLALLMQTVFDIAKFTLKDGIIDDITSRVYLIITIFMVFKITISLLGYMINPDAISDKSKGVSKLVEKILVSLIMLIMLPMVFGKIMDLQDGVYETLPRLVLGTETGYDDDNNMTETGKGISWAILKTFFYYSQSCKDYENLDDLTINEFTDVDSDANYKDEIATFAGEINAECNANHSYYRYEYQPVISTIAGIFAIWILLGITIKVVVRMFKLVILKVMAPIPIISFMDPGQGKDGIFSKWSKMLIKTWLDLFINLGILYLAIYFIDLVASGGLQVEGFENFNWFRKSLFNVFMILGIFTFAKKAPKFICDALGIKDDGFSGFGEILSGAAIGGALDAVGAAGATAIGGVGSTISSARASYMSDEVNGRNHNFLRLGKNAIAGVLGGAAGTLESASAGINAKDHRLKAVTDTFNNNNARTNAYGVAGSSFFGREAAKVSALTTGMTQADRVKARENELTTAETALKNHKSTIESRFDGNDKFIMEYEGKQFNWVTTERMYQAAINGDQTAINNLTQTFGNDAVSYFTNHYDDIHKEGYESFSDAIINGKNDAEGNSVTDSVVIESYKNLQDAVKNVYVDEYDNLGNPTGKRTNLSRSVNGLHKNTKSNLGNTTSTKGSFTRSARTKAAKADANAVKK